MLPRERESKSQNIRQGSRLASALSADSQPSTARAASMGRSSLPAMTIEKAPADRCRVSIDRYTIGNAACPCSRRGFGPTVDCNKPLDRFGGPGQAFTQSVKKID